MLDLQTLNKYIVLLNDRNFQKYSKDFPNSSSEHILGTTKTSCHVLKSMYENNLNIC